MKAIELKTKSIDELKQLLLKMLKKQFGLRMQSGMGELPKPHQFKEVRRDIARIKTFITAKEETA